MSNDNTSNGLSNRLESVVKRLNRIAEANRDVFKCTVEIEVRRKGICYRFECGNSQGTFVSGIGSSADAAAMDAHQNVSKACEAWGYEEVD